MALDSFTLFLSGDVMTGRGIDQVLPDPCDPELRESYVRDAREYVALAERASGPVPRPVSLEHIWGDALTELARVGPHARIVNLETSITRSGAFWPAKAVNYRMSPENAACLAAAGLHVCGLANNHVIDFGFDGLLETLATLDRLSIAHAGAGSTIEEAEAPAIVDVAGLGRVLVFALASPTAGVPAAWAATRRSAGVCYAPDLSPDTVQRVRAMIEAHVQPRDVVILSIHWGPNWGYEVTSEERRFAHALVDEAGVHVVHGHSSHHVKGIEVHDGRLILYGCGDFLSDYEGIHGYESYRGDLGLMYFPTLDARSGRLERLEMVATRVRGFQVTRADVADTRWLCEMLNREGEALGSSVDEDPEGRLQLR